MKRGLVWLGKKAGWEGVVSLPGADARLRCALTVSTPCYPAPRSLTRPSPVNPHRKARVSHQGFCEPASQKLAQVKREMWPVRTEGSALPLCAKGTNPELTTVDSGTFRRRITTVRSAWSHGHVTHGYQNDSFSKHPSTFFLFTQASDLRSRLNRRKEVKT